MQEPRAFALEAGGDVDLASAYQAATSWNEGKGMFASWHDKVAGPLLLAYRLYLKVIAGGDDAKAFVLSDAYFKTRQRLPGKKATLALIAIQLVAKPDGETDKTMCSQYADYLDFAVARNIHPDEFAERMNGVTLDEVRKEKKKGKKPRALDSESSQDAVKPEAVPILDAAPTMLLA